jgi:fructoselysine 3-epimerase
MVSAMKRSLSSFIYYNFPLAEAIRRTAKAGFEGIDIWGGRPHAYRRDLGPKDLIALRQVLSDEGLNVASFIPAQFRYPTSLCSPVEAIREDSINYLKEGIDTAAELGAPLVHVCPGHSIHGQSKEDAMSRLCESIRDIAEYAAGQHIRVAIEPADKYETDLLTTCEASLKIVEELGYENLGVLLDNGHAHVVGESCIEAVAFLGSRLFHVHLDDNNGLRDQHLVPGDGTFDFPPFIAALKQAGYEGFLGAELGWDYTIDPDPAAQLAAGRMAAMLHQVSVNSLILLTLEEIK